MRLIIYILLISFSVFYSVKAEEKTIQHQSSTQIRTEKDIKRLISHGQINNPHVIKDTPHMWNKLPNGKEVSLKNGVRDEILTALEDSLVKIFDDVIINSNFPKCYFIILNGDIGVCKLDGTIVVPPVAGFPRKLSSIGGLRVGDTTPFSEVEGYFKARTGERARGTGGNLAAVLNDKTLEPIIPFGKYEYIYYTMKGMKSYYYVAKKNGDSYLWGCVDANGNQLVPCQYKCITVEHGHFKGDNSEDMFARIYRLREKINEYNSNMSTSTIDFIRKFGNYFSTFGNSLIKLDNSLNESGIYDLLSQGSNQKDDLHNEDSNVSPDLSEKHEFSWYQSQYDKWARKAESDYNSITRYSTRDSKGKKKEGNANQSSSPSNYVLQKKAYRTAQHEMEKIRRAAKQHGFTLTQSEYETLSIQY